MSTVSSYPPKVRPAASRVPLASVALSPAMVWLTAALAGLSVAWPLISAMLLYGPGVIVRSLTGDSYHYLAIARKAEQSGRYTYDGVHVTNGFHPLWEYTMRGMFHMLRLQSHEAQAVAVMLLALLSTSLGVALASAAVIRMTRQKFLGLLMAPGLFYLLVGVQVKTLWIWSSLDGMESAFSTLFGGALFLILSFYMGASATRRFRPVEVYRALGLLLPFLILSRLDDVFLVPAFLLALLVFNTSLDEKLKAGLWISAPSVLAVLGYLVYNHLTVGAGMPLSGGTKSGFVGAIAAYLTIAVHFPPLLNLNHALTGKAVDGATVFSNSFRFVEVAYPLLLTGFGAAAIWKYARRRIEYMVFFALCVYALMKLGYNFLMVHPWHQATWYYALIALSLSVMGAWLLREPWAKLAAWPIAQYATVTVYAGMMLLAGSQYFAQIVYQSADSAATSAFWDRYGQVRSELVEHGVTGIINEDDGITAFLLDMPNMHGFAFATDVEAQKAHRDGRMLTLAYQRGINTLAGAGYLANDNPPATDATIREYLRKSIAVETMKNDEDNFTFTLAYYDPVLRMPFYSFTPKR